jgi:single-strand DNA-binding protein
MARDLNSVFIIGRLSQDPEFKMTSNGKELLKFSVANNRSFGQNEGNNDANFFNVLAWGKLATVMKEFLTKGKQIAIQGRLQQNRWEQDGQNRSRVEIVAENIQLLGGTGGGGGGQSYSPSPGSGGSSENTGGGGYTPPPSQGPDTGGYSDGPGNDDIPF